MPENPSHDRSHPTLWDSHDTEPVRPAERVRERSRKPAQEKENLHRPKADGLIEQMLTKANLRRALQRVESNRGAPGSAGMRTDELRLFLDAEWPRPQTNSPVAPTDQPVTRVEIPKPFGGTRALGVPTVWPTSTTRHRPPERSMVDMTRSVTGRPRSSSRYLSLSPAISGSPARGRQRYGSAPDSADRSLQ